MARFQLCFLLALLIQFSWSQDTSSTESSKDEERNPVAVLLSNLRSIVDNPGPPFEDGLFHNDEERRKEPMYGKPRQDYFKRIQENYGKLQKQVGSMLDELAIPKNLFGASGSSSVDVKVPFFPINVKVKTSVVQKEPAVPGFFDVFDDKREDKSSMKGSVDVSMPEIDVRVSSKVRSGGDDGKKGPTSSIATNVRVGDVKIKVDSDSGMLKRFGQAPATRSWIELGELTGTSRGKREAIEFASEERKQSFSAAYYEFLQDPATDTSIDMITEPLDGRILGEVFYSEEAFDNMTKEAIKNAKWALDSDLDPSKILDQLDAVAKLVLQRRRPKSSKSKRAPLAEPEPKEATVLLALTEDGVPVQLRIGPEVDNPFRFLHKVLAASQVTLRVQTKGSTDEGVPDPIFLVDMSDPKQMSSFLKTLRKFKPNLNENSKM